ncbi:MAG: hypothetical protein MUO43_10115 [Desulfobacterales bacterium]|nr:hypothetical protein [Desulfobacterales bacterium]
MLSRGVTEEMFINAVSIIASNNGCRIVDIDLAKHIINLEGPAESEISCGIEIENVLGKYLEDPLPIKNDYMENNYYGWHSLVA